MKPRTKTSLYRLGAVGLFVGVVAAPLVATATLQTAQVGSDLTTGRSEEVFGYAVKLTEDGNRVAISGQYSGPPRCDRMLNRRLKGQQIGHRDDGSRPNLAIPFL